MTPSKRLTVIGVENGGSNPSWGAIFLKGSLMIVEKEVQRNYKQTIIDKYICDLCGSQSKDDNWVKGTYEVDEISVSRITGVRYPEGGNVTVETFDICPNCWETKLVPWMKSQNASPRVKEIDY